MTEKTILDQLATEHVEISDMALQIIKDRGIAEFIAGAIMQRTDGNIGGMLFLLLQVIHHLCEFDDVGMDLDEFLDKLLIAYEKSATIAAQVEALGETKQ